MNAEQNNEFKSSNYELFILALSLLSLLNWVLYFILTDEDILRVVFFVDLVLSFSVTDLSLSSLSQKLDLELGETLMSLVPQGPDGDDFQLGAYLRG